MYEYQTAIINVKLKNVWRKFAKLKLNLFQNRPIYIEQYFPGFTGVVSAVRLLLIYIKFGQTN